MEFKTNRRAEGYSGIKTDLRRLPYIILITLGICVFLALFIPVVPYSKWSMSISGGERKLSCVTTLGTIPAVIQNYEEGMSWTWSDNTTHILSTKDFFNNC